MKFDRKHIITALKGFAMGTADIIPGVSGGTIAFITGIYEPLMNSISSVNHRQIRPALTLLFYFWHTEKRAVALKQLEGLNFALLIPLFLGLITAILIMARIMPYLLETYPFAMNSLFFGLILFSITLPMKQMKKTPGEMIALAIFAILTFGFLSEPFFEEGSRHPLFLFVSGAIAICSMVLPGISGSYMLVLMGQYSLVLTAVKQFDFTIIIPFVLGIAIGLISFAKLLKYLLAHHRSLTMAALTGFLCGSLRVLWPGNHDPKFIQDFSVAAVGIFFIVLGAVFLWGMERLSHRLSHQES